MFGLTEAHLNIVKRRFREMSSELKAAIEGGAKYDHVAKRIIDEHHKKDGVHTLVTRQQFIWLAGYFNGRFGNKFDYE